MCVSARARLGGRLERRGCRDGENETDRQKNRGSTGVALTGQEQEKERKLEAGSEAGGGATSEEMGATGRPCVCTCACVFPCLAASRYVSRAVKGAGTTPDCGLRDGPTSWTLAWRPPLPAPPPPPPTERASGERVHAPPRRRLLPAGAVSRFCRRLHSTWRPAPGLTVGPWRWDRPRVLRMRQESPEKPPRAPRRRVAAGPSSLGARSPAPARTRLPRCGCHSACCCSSAMPRTCSP